jgi:signal transduction histidine kinase
VRFRHRLEGLESAWVEAGTRREAHYSHLPPGKYTFLVTACNKDGVWNEQASSLSFVVLPHFYETRWFQALMAAVAVVFVAGTVRFVVVRRMRRELELLERQRAVERDRARIAQDIHDDLGAGLTRIMLQSELARREPPEEILSHLNRIGDVARGMTRTMDEIVWAVDPKHDTLSGLMDYATAFAEEFLQLASIRCRVDLPSEIPRLHVDAELRYNLFLALKEALNNVVRHAHATEVWLRLRVGENEFTLVVEDNGRGLAAAEGDGGARRIVSGHGLSNLEKRLETVGGQCVVVTAPGGGVRLEMTVRTHPSGSTKMAMRSDVPTEV